VTCTIPFVEAAPRSVAIGWWQAGGHEFAAAGVPSAVAGAAETIRNGIRMVNGRVGRGTPT
jgi:hypothetical protein